MSPLTDTSPNPLLIFSRASNPITDARTALSSWPNCMAVSYCKWPVIIAIIVAVLIVGSVVMCIARVLCCGVECCCMCCSCFNACCPSPRRTKTKTKYVEAPQQLYAAPPQQPYSSQAPMNYGGAAPGGFQSTPARSFQSPAFNQPRPQFATFDSSSGKPITEDSLPAMPSWQTAQSRKVEIEPETTVIDDDDKVSNIGEEHGIAMGTLPSVGRRVKDDDDGALYEDPEDLRKPILQDQEHQMGSSSRLGYNDGTASPYGYDRSEYADSVATGPSQTRPTHPYGSYNNQVNESPYGAQDARSPTSQSQYSSGYPPTYASRNPPYDRAPSYTSRAPTYSSRGPGPAPFNRDQYQSPHSSPSPPLGGAYRSPTSPPNHPYGGPGQSNNSYRGPNSPPNDPYRGPSPPQNSYRGPNSQPNDPYRNPSPAQNNPYGGPSQSQNSYRGPSPPQNNSYRGPTSPPPAGSYQNSSGEYGRRSPGTRGGAPPAQYGDRSPPPLDTSYGGQDSGYQRDYSPSQSTQYESTQYETPSVDRLPTSLMSGQAPPQQRSYGRGSGPGGPGGPGGNYGPRRSPGGF